MDGLEIYRVERDSADGWARYYFNLRLGAMTFFVLTLGTLLAYAWANGYNVGFSSASLKQRIARFVILIACDVLAASTVFLEGEFRRRYDIAWKLALRMEMQRIMDGFHEQLDVQLPKVPLRTVARFVYTIIGAFLGGCTLAEFSNWAILILGGLK